MRVVALAPGLASREINLVAAQESPDILDVDIAKFPGQQGPGPAREPRRRRFIEQLQNPFVGRLRVDRLLARPPFALQSFKAKVGKAMPPKADYPRLDPNFLGDRSGATPGRRQKNNPRPLQNRAAMSPGSGNRLQAPCDLSSKGGLLLLRIS